MARLIKCPRCQAQVDVSTNTGGATVPCPDCGVQLRVPTGQTGTHQKVAEPVAASSSGKKDTAFRARTPIMSKMGGAKGYGAPGTKMPRGGGGYERGGNSRQSNNLPLIIGGVVAGVALIVVLVVALGNNKPVEKPKRIEQPIADAPDPDPEPENPTPAGTGEPPKKPKPLLQKEDGKYVAPTSFERGAEKFRQGSEPFKVEPSVASTVEGLLKAGNFKEVIAKDHVYFPALVNCFIADDEGLARKAFECISAWCDAKNLKTESGKNPINIELFNSAQWRGGAFAEWSDWYGKNKDAMDPSVVNGPRNVDPKMIDWARFAQNLRGGQGYDDEKRPEGAVMATLKSIKHRIAVENLAPFIAPDGEPDLMSSRAINAALEHLTGQKMPSITAGNVQEIKKRWLEWASKQP